jgi:hypothetical protein
MEGININKNLQEKSFDPLLEELWVDYDFHGRPPFVGSVAEKRLKETCDKYANYVDHDKHELPGEERNIYGDKKTTSYEIGRRELHNQVAVMVVGKQRSGMDENLARNIAEFAYEYSRGYKIGEEGEYKN